MKIAFYHHPAHHKTTMNRLLLLNKDNKLVSLVNDPTWSCNRSFLPTHASDNTTRLVPVVMNYDLSNPDGFTDFARQTGLWLQFTEDPNKSHSEALGSLSLCWKALDGPDLPPLRQRFDGKVRLYVIRSDEINLG